MTGDVERKYETLGVIGQGGMATVFVGRALGAAGFRRLVAVKRAHAHVRDDPALAASMKHEAGLAARLHHPNVVRVIDVVEETDDLVLVLDYVEGGSLSELLSRPAFASFPDARSRARVVVRIVLDIAAGLDAAHRALDDHGDGLGIVHRDVSPSNVLVGVDGIARLTDFGIAKALEGGSDRTETGVLKGKIAYMAPEYVEHQRADAAADQFSLGVVAWEALADRRLFRGRHEVETLKRVMMCQVPSLAEIEPAMAPLEPVLSRALSRAPADRFGSVRDLAEALETAARGAGLVASHGEVGELVERAMRDDLAARRRLVRGLTDSDVESTRSGALQRGRDDVATASIMGPPSSRPHPDVAVAPSAASGAKAERSAIGRPVVVAIAIATAIVLAGAGAVVASRADVTAETIDASAAGETATSASVSAVATGAPSLDDDGVEPATSSTAPPPARPSRSGTGRRPAPSGGIVPRKAPPNPYVH